ncbi:hypothetical protein TI39_contig5841g00004 [Zymoseptoria brevis]|uniref:C2H2-type domain-containing protein n=1 Tax=Zymoseptoria brevis TaxID=1047168 RepID=A0A0F4G5D6_9PEZI|nr:hypothetical protein TI39_contig5841g00004 [Zymoseptoria brevis]
MPAVASCGDDQYTCAACNKPIFKRDRTQHERSRRHLQKETGSRGMEDHLCSHCPKGFTRPSDAQRHERNCSSNPNSARGLKRRRDDQTSPLVVHCGLNQVLDFRQEELFAELNKVPGQRREEPFAEFDDSGRGSSISSDASLTNPGSDGKHPGTGGRFQTCFAESELSPGSDSGTELATPPDLRVPRPTSLTSYQDSGMSKRNSILSFLQLPARKPPPSVRQIRCHLCRKLVDNDAVNLIAHLKDHQGKFAEHKCDDCEVGFQHHEDLSYHLECTSGTNAHRGFNFEHTTVCTGHHPPDPRQPPESYPEHDRFKLGYFARNWEGEQLRALMESMDYLLTEEPDKSRRWSSLTDVKRRWSMLSLSETIASFKTTPANIDYNARRSIAADEAKLRRGTPSALTRAVSNARKEVHGLKNASKMANAIQQSDFATVIVLLEAGVKVIPSHLERALLLAMDGLSCEYVFYHRHTIVERLLDARSQSSGWMPDFPIEKILRSTWPEALERRQHQLVKLLIDHGADIHQSEGFRMGCALTHASLNADSDMVEILLSKGFHATIEAHQRELTSRVLPCVEEECEMCS